MSDTQVLFRDATRFVLSDGIKIAGVEQAQIADTFEGVLYPRQPLPQILARGRWVEPRPGTKAEDILMLVEPR